MDDLISRRKAIDRINKQREHLQPDIYPQDKIGDTAYRICAEFITRLPTVQPDHTADIGKKVSISCGRENDLIPEHLRKRCFAE